MANYNYKGTKITGISTSAKKFTDSKVKDADKNQTYFNTSTGHVYKCTKGGGPKKAEWKYARTDIAKKPNKTVTKLATPKRNGNVLTASWQVPAALKDKKNGARAQNIKITWTINWINSKGKTGTWKLKDSGGTGFTSSSINLNNFKYNGKKKDRKSFYPKTGLKIDSVSVSVCAHNSKGDGKRVTKTFDYQIPREPTFSAYSFNTENGDLTIMVNTNAGADKKERYDTEYKTKAYYSTTDETTEPPDSKGKNTDTSFTVTFDAGGYQGLDYDNFIRVTTEARSRGLQGCSAWASPKKPYYISYPAKVSIENVEVSSQASDGKFTAFIKTNHTDEHPVDRVRLEYLANVPYATAASIPGEADWQATDITDDNNCTALAMPVGNLLPDPGKHTWVRVKSWHASESVLYQYSEPKEITDLHITAPTAEDDEITILSAVPGIDGKSIIAHLGWNADGTDDSTGTELSWSEAEDSWRSTDNPDDYLFTWSDGPIYELTEDTTPAAGKTYYTKSGDTYSPVQNPAANPKTAGYYECTYQDSASITIKGLDEGTQYFIKARRYLETEDGTTYSGYSNTAMTITSETPESIVATCDRYVPEGASLPVYWTFSGNGLQKAWQIMPITVSYELTTDTEVIGIQTYYRYDSVTETYVIVKFDSGESGESGDSGDSGTSGGSSINPSAEGWYVAVYTENGAPLAKGEGSIGATQIDAERLAAFAVNNEVTFNVQVSTGGEYVKSEACAVSIIDAPTLSIAVASPLTTNALSFAAISSRICDLSVIVTSLGAAGQFPEGILQQTSGDTIHSDIYKPDWTESQGSYSTTVNLPTGLGFWDLGNYHISVVAIDRNTGLQSAPAEADFSVAWANQAVSVLAIETYTLTADTVVDDEKTYYEYDSTEQSYVLVVPDGDEDPAQEGWYEQNVTNFVTLTPIDTVDDNGMHHQAVEIALTPPTGCSETDVYDIYRLTGDGVYLIGEGFPLTYTATDEYAPFGDDMTHYYRVALRTVDGDVEFGDFEYNLDCSFMRFDWATGSLELPYNLSIGDKYKKNVEIRKHMDGSMDGYWNQNVERTASLSSDVIRLTMQDEIDAARQLARYTGPVFVRTPDGSAYEADVQVSDMSTEGIMTAIAIDATEIGLTQEFVLPTPFVLESGESGGSGGSGESGGSGTSGGA